MQELLEKEMVFDDVITEDARQNFLLFLEEVRSETANCSIANHTNHSNHSNW
jgi:hypothetical protein